MGFVHGGRVGIIPAYAGSTASYISRVGPPPDHPRIRGEHYAAHKVAIEAGGSSPHTRGALSAAGRSGRRSGIIPAYAGSTASRALTRNIVEDHPRIRGEHAQMPLAVLPWTGSSPHTRGAQRRQPAREAGSRIIPAYAGSTEEETKDAGTKTDHPRIRGEHPVRIPVVI